MSTFREAIQEAPTTPVEAPKSELSEGGSPIQTHAETLLATYKEDMGVPYTADYLDIKDIWDKTEGLSKEVETIESYLQEQVELGNLENSTKSAEKYLKELESKAGINEYETTTKRITKILAYINFQKVVNS